MQQKREALLKEKETSEKVAARAFAQSYLSDLLPSVFSNLNEGGFFYDPVERGTMYMYCRSYCKVCMHAHNIINTA